MAPHIANGHDGMMGGHPCPMHHKQRPPPLKTCAELPKAGMTTSVGGEQAPHHTTKVMMAPHIANGHDGMMGGHPCPMHHKQRPPHLSRLVQNCPSAVMTTSVGDEQAPHHTTKVMMAPHIANGHDGMMGATHAPCTTSRGPPPLKTCAELP